MEQLFFILNLATMFLVVFLIFLLVIAYTRFSKGEFKSVVLWISLAYIFAGASHIVYFVSLLFLNVPGYMVPLETIFYALAKLCALISAIKVYKFSKVFGLAK